MELDDEVINFNIYDDMCYPDDVLVLKLIYVIEPLTEEYFEITNCGSLDLVLHRNTYVNAAHVLSEKFLVEN